jgi:hypothetical protein
MIRLCKCTCTKTSLSMCAVRSRASIFSPTSSRAPPLNTVSSLTCLLTPVRMCVDRLYVFYNARRGKEKRVISFVQKFSLASRRLVAACNNYLFFIGELILFGDRVFMNSEKNKYVDIAPREKMNVMAGTDDEMKYCEIV